MREKNLETCLVITTGFAAVGALSGNAVLLYVAIGVGVIGVFFNKLASGINWLWYKIADVFGMIVPQVLLTVVFFVFLFPIALIYRMFNKDSLQLKKKREDSYWQDRNHQYSAKDLENPW